MASLNINVGASVGGLQKAIEAVSSLLKNFGGQIAGTNTELKNAIAKASADMDEAMADVTKSFDTFGNAGAKSTDKVSGSTKSLRTQLREATIAAQQLSEKYGINSTQAIAAQKTAGKLKDEIGDMAARINAFNPDARFKAFTDVLKGASGAFGAVTGGMQLFGVESENAHKAMAKLQAIMAITQGLDAIKGMGDSFKTVQASIKMATAGMSAMKLVMMSLGIGAIIALVAGLAMVLGGEGDEAETAAKKTEKFNASIDEMGRVAGLAYRNMIAAGVKEQVAFKVQMDEKSKEMALYESKKQKFQDHINMGTKGAMLAQDKAEIKILQDKIDEIQTVLNEGNKKISDLNKKDSDESQKKQEESSRKAIESATKRTADLTKTAEDKRKFDLDLQLRTAGTMEDGMRKELILLAIKHKDELDATTKQKEDLIKIYETQDAEAEAVRAKFKQKEDEEKQKKIEIDSKPIEAAAAAYEDFYDKMNAANAVSGIFKQTSKDVESTMGDAEKAIRDNVVAFGLESATVKDLLVILDKLKIKYKELSEAEKQEEASKKAAAETAKQYADAYSNAVQSAIKATANLVADSVTQMIQGTFTMEGFMQGLLLMVAGFAKQLGEAFIGIAAAKIVVDLMLPIPGGAALALAAGIGLVVASNLMVAKAQKMSGFAVGSNYIPYDMTAQVHRGEMIVPAAANPYANPFTGSAMGGASRTQVYGRVSGSDIELSSTKYKRWQNRIV